ncbi:MAG TPA: porin [Planctomycetaceae bacterium]|nr:porin [Planctomycetaceae bacterium]
MRRTWAYWWVAGVVVLGAGRLPAQTEARALLSDQASRPTPAASVQLSDRAQIAAMPTGLLTAGASCDTCAGKAADSCDDCGGKGSGSGSCCDEPWSLFPVLPRGIRVGGWLSGGVTYNAKGINNGTGNFPVEFGNASDGFLGNQAWAFVERVANTGGNGVDWGFRADYVFGADAPNTQAFGDQTWDFSWNSSRDYGSAIPQLYFDLAINNLTIRAGHFFTIIGYESVPAANNFFYSHSLTMNYGEPFTHTGILGIYEVNPCWTLYAGWSMGWDSGFDNRDDGQMAIGGLAWTPNDWLEVRYMFTAGNWGDGTPTNAGDLYMHSFVASMEVTERLTYVFQSDYALNFNLPNTATDPTWYGANNYFFYEINPCWKLGARIEWFRDKQGVRLGTAGNFYEATAGLNWAPTANFRVRPEVRWDWYQGAGQPFHGGTDKDITTFGVDFVWLF